MQNNDRPKFATLMKALGETYGNTAPSKERVELYFRVLSDLSIEQVEEGVIALLNTRTTTSTFPVPGEIRQSLSGGQSAALIALDKAERAVERYGSYRSVQFDDPVIHMVISAMGGWPKFCVPDPVQAWHWYQKEFCRMYEAFAKHGRECPEVLYGICARENTANAIAHDDSLCIIGDGAKSLAWQRQLKNDTTKMITMKGMEA